MSEEPQQPQQQPQSPQPHQPGERESFFGPNARWLWFAGGVVFIAFGVLFAYVLNLRKSKEDREDAMKWALLGMAIGFAMNIFFLMSAGGIDTLFGTGATSPSTGGIF